MADTLTDAVGAFLAPMLSGQIGYFAAFLGAGFVWAVSFILIGVRLVEKILDYRSKAFGVSVFLIYVAAGLAVGTLIISSGIEWGTWAELPA